VQLVEAVQVAPVDHFQQRRQPGVFGAAQRPQHVVAELSPRPAPALRKAGSQPKHLATS